MWLNYPIIKGSLIPWQPNSSNYPPHCKSKIENLKCSLPMLSNCPQGPGIVALDGNRCPTCRCSQRPIDVCSFKCDNPGWTHMPLSDRLCECPAPHDKCAKIEASCNRDALRCPNGFEKDLEGCDLCFCKSWYSIYITILKLNMVYSRVLSR